MKLRTNAAGAVCEGARSSNSRQVITQGYYCSSSGRAHGWTSSPVGAIPTRIEEPKTPQVSHEHPGCNSLSLVEHRQVGKRDGGLNDSSGASRWMGQVGIAVAFKIRAMPHTYIDRPGVRYKQSLEVTTSHSGGNYSSVDGGRQHFCRGPERRGLYEYTHRDNL